MKEINTNKFIFLDLDGVLNSNLYYCEKHHNDRYAEAIAQYPEELALGISAIDPVAVGNLNKILEATGAKIVVSSSWRHDPYLPDIFKAVGIKAPIFSITPLSESRIRGEEIQAWLDKQTEPYTYVILDDDSDMLESQLPYFVQTDWMKRGLSQDDAEQAIKILNEHD